MSSQVKSPLVSRRAVDLSLKILGDDGLANAYYLEYLLLNFPHARALRGLEWLYAKGIRGKHFAEFISECDRMPLEFCKQVFKGMNRDSEVQPIYAKELIR